MSYPKNSLKIHRLQYQYPRKGQKKTIEPGQNLYASAFRGLLHTSIFNSNMGRILTLINKIIFKAIQTVKANKTKLLGNASYIVIL